MALHRLTPWRMSFCNSNGRQLVRAFLHLIINWQRKVSVSHMVKGASKGHLPVYNKIIINISPESTKPFIDGTTLLPPGRWSLSPHKDYPLIFLEKPSGSDTTFIVSEYRSLKIPVISQESKVDYRIRSFKYLQTFSGAWHIQDRRLHCFQDHSRPERHHCLWSFP